MAEVTMRDMLEAGLHYGHQTKRWNPKMKPFIYGPRNGIYIINLDHTFRMFRQASQFVTEAVAKGGTVLFVGTKVQGREIIAEEASRCGMYYVNQRWLGGMLTNFQTIRRSIDRLKQIDAMREDGTIHRFPKKEILTMDKEAEKLERHLGGIKQMRSLPSVLFVVDPKKEHIAVDEANKLGIPVVAITDTNCDPDLITYVIPGNDDAIRAIKLISSLIAEAILEGKAQSADGTGETVEVAGDGLLDAMANDAAQEPVQQ